MNEQKDILGIGKTFRLEYLESSTYKNQYDEIENGDILPSIMIGTLERYTNPTVGHVYLRDGQGGINIIPCSRIISMIHMESGVVSEEDTNGKI